MIERKLKACKSCTLPRMIFSRGRCKQCAHKEDYKGIQRQAIQANRIFPKARIYRPPSGELNRWFQDRRTEMTGYCHHCGNVSSRDDDRYYKFSLAHILPKNIFKSIKTHPLNSVELCFWNNSCHTNFDHKTLDLMDLNCFHEVIEKFIAMYPDIAPNERKYIPATMLNYITIDI
jgi:hypothetical protein